MKAHGTSRLRQVKNPIPEYRGTAIALIPMRSDTFNDRFVDPSYSVQREPRRDGGISGVPSTIIERTSASAMLIPRVANKTI